MKETALIIPEFCLVLLVGPSGAGKSIFAQRHFRDTEVISSDNCRGLVCDDEGNQTVTEDAFNLLHTIVEKRLKNRRLTVVDATNLLAKGRAGLLRIAKEYHTQVVAIIFNLDIDVCLKRNNLRPNRQVKPNVVREHIRTLKSCRKQIKKEGIRQLFTLNSPEEIEAIKINRRSLSCNKREETGPFDIIGDIHGCADELEQLLEKLGYKIKRNKDRAYTITPPMNRRAIFVGDLMDRGPRTPDVLRIVKSMVEAGTALCVKGNHEIKLVRVLDGKDVTLTHGLDKSLDQFATETSEFRHEMRDFMDGLVSHYVLDGGKLVVAHAGLCEDMQGRSSGAVRAFCAYGDTTGEKDNLGLPIRRDWAKLYKGSAKVVYGHVPNDTLEWVNGTLCIDTACVFGGNLTALRYPEMELIDVPAAKIYCAPAH